MKKHFSGLSLVAVLSLATLNQTVLAQTERKVDPWFQEGLFIYDITSNAINPANLVNLPYSGLNDIDISYTGDKGYYRTYDGSTKSRLFNANVFGVRQFERLSFKGNINYSNHYNEDMRWNATTLTSALNPFLIADTLRYDSLTNDSRTESFVINGAVAYKLNDRFTAGVSAKYNVSHKTDQSDPRMKANAARTTVIPGINWTINSSFTLGLAGLFEVYHENVNSTVQDNMIGDHNKVYIYKGLGGYEGKDGLGYNRRYDGHKFGGSLNFSITGILNNFTEIRFVSNSENAIDGGTSYSYKGGDFSQTAISLSSRFMLNRNDKLQHDLVLEAGIDKCDGTWYNQKQKKDSWKMTEYEITSTELIHKESDMTASLSYMANFLKSGISHLSLTATGAYKQVDIKQFPDGNYAKYTRINAGLTLNKKWIAKKMRYTTQVYAGMNHALKPLDISVALNDAPTKRFYYGYYLPKYTYLSSNDYCVSLKLGASYPLSLFSQAGWLNLTMDASLNKYTGDSSILTGTDKKAFGIKLNYTF